jgi:hypothetical protein
MKGEFLDEVDLDFASGSARRSLPWMFWVALMLSMYSVVMAASTIYEIAFREMRRDWPTLTTMRVSAAFYYLSISFALWVHVWRTSRFARSASALDLSTLLATTVFFWRWLAIGTLAFVVCMVVLTASLARYA